MAAPGSAHYAELSPAPADARRLVSKPWRSPPRTRYAGFAMKPGTRVLVVEDDPAAPVELGERLEGLLVLGEGDDVPQARERAAAPHRH